MDWVFSVLDFSKITQTGTELSVNFLSAMRFKSE